MGSVYLSGLMVKSKRTVKHLLCKRICKRCVDGTCSGWSLFDEYRWENVGSVLCPEELRSTYKGATLFSEIPEWCPYVVEHVVETT